MADVLRVLIVSASVMGAVGLGYVATVKGIRGYSNKDEFIEPVAGGRGTIFC